MTFTKAQMEEAWRSEPVGTLKRLSEREKLEKKHKKFQVTFKTFVSHKESLDDSVEIFRAKNISSARKIAERMQSNILSESRARHNIVVCSTISIGISTRITEID